eukprot:g21523.t1
MTYADEEGDLCILAPATFPDFLSLHQKTQSRMLKLLGGREEGMMRLLRTLRMLKESGVLTAAKLPSFTVVWLPFLAKIAALQVEKINKMAKDGLDPCFQKMLEIIQDLCGPA